MSNKNKLINGQATMNSDEIIILDDDEEDEIINEQSTSNKNKRKTTKKASGSLNGEKSPNKKRGFCANTRCKSNNKGILKYCPIDVLRFYKINVDKNSEQFLCDACFEKAIKEIGVIFLYSIFLKTMLFPLIIVFVK